MTLDELVRDLERRRADAARIGASAPLAKVYGALLEDIRTLDGESQPGRHLTTSEAAALLSCSTKTVRRWIDAGRFPGARKTSAHGTGEWRIPAEEVRRAAAGPAHQDRPIPRLWSPDDA